MEIMLEVHLTIWKKVLRLAKSFLEVIWVVNSREAEWILQERCLQVLQGALGRQHV